MADIIGSVGPEIRVMNGQTRAVIADFDAFDAGAQNIIAVQAAQYGTSPNPEIVAIADDSEGSHVKVFDGVDQDLLASFYAGAM
jgi:hypothetical protein